MKLSDCLHSLKRAFVPSPSRPPHVLRARLDVEPLEGRLVPAPLGPALGQSPAALVGTTAHATILIIPYQGTYDGQSHGLTGTARGARGEDLSSLLRFSATFRNAGHYTVAWTFAGNQTYAAASGTSTVDIAVRPITVAADPQSKVFGDADPSLTYHVTAGSLANGDSFSGALTRQPGEDPGSYAIRQGTLTAGRNYRLTYVGASLTIAPVAVSVSLGTSAPIAVACEPVTFSVVATASPAGGATLPGSVTFTDGTTVLATVPLVGGQASFTTDGLGIGNHTISAVYDGGKDYQAPAPTPLRERVLQGWLLPDPAFRSKYALFIGGTPGDDLISVHMDKWGNTIASLGPWFKVKWQLVVTGTISRVIIYGGTGTDGISVASVVPVPVLVWRAAGEHVWIDGGDNGKVNIVDLPALSPPATSPPAGRPDTGPPIGGPALLGAVERAVAALTEELALENRLSGGRDGLAGGIGLDLYFATLAGLLAG